MHNHRHEHWCRCTLGACVGSMRFFQKWCIGDCDGKTKYGSLPILLINSHRTDSVVCRQMCMLWVNVFRTVHIHIRSVKVAVKHTVPCTSFLPQLLFEHTDLYKNSGYSGLVHALQFFSWTELKLLSTNMRATAMMRKNFMWKVRLKWNGKVTELLI